MNNLGTWIDWQYLQNAAKLLAKVCTTSLFRFLVQCLALSGPDFGGGRGEHTEGDSEGGISTLCSPAYFRLHVDNFLCCVH